jgi:hypothetical protein
MEAAPMLDLDAYSACPACNATGEIVHGRNPWDPDRVERCVPCGGTGEVPATCSECEAPAATACCSRPLCAEHTTDAGLHSSTCDADARKAAA